MTGLGASEEHRGALTLRDLEVAFGGQPALRGVDLDVAPGEFLALLGPSGCGKSTLLRVISGLLPPDHGRLAIGETPVADGASGYSLAPERRGIGMVFQDYALWPHLSVSGNVAFPLEMRGVGRAERRRRVAEVLELVGLQAFAERSPGTLSGGQQQRVALARALVARPGVVLFDEPLSNLDLELRETLADEIAAIVRELGVSAVYVTHDQTEAFGVSDRVGVLVDGRLRQIAPAETVFRDPADQAVAEFVRAGVLVDGIMTGDGDGFRAAAGGVPIPLMAGHRTRTGRLLLPRHALSLAPAHSSSPVVAAQVTRCRYRGDCYALRAHLEGEQGPLVELHTQAPVNPGARVALAIDARKCRFFPGDEAAGETTRAIDGPEQGAITAAL